MRTLLGVEDPDAPAPASGIDLIELLSPFDTEPPPEQMAEEVASLRAYVLPVLEELEPTWYEEGPCDILEYPRARSATTRHAEGARRSSRSTPPPAPTSTGSSTRSSGAGSPPTSCRAQGYSLDGTVESAGFLRSGGGIEWNFAYLHSPDEQPAPWESSLGPVTITPIADTSWWFEKSPHD